MSFSESSAPRNSVGLVAGMGGCYALGTFTDNFFKMAAVLMAAQAQLAWVQSVATILYSLPFVLFSAWAGWLADRMVKKHIVVAAKAVELLALIFGALALFQGNWAGILLALFCMGVQATAFSPALNGSIPECFDLGMVPRVNSLIKLASTVAVLAGMALAGIFLDLRPGSLLPDIEGAYRQEYGRAMAGIFVVFMAALGLLLSLTLRRRPVPVSARVPFPWTGPVDSVRHLLECRKDEQLFLVLMAEGFFYGVAAVAVICVANLSKQMGYSDTVASLLTAALMIGIAAGAIVAGRGTAESWRRLLVPSALGMGACLLLTGASALVPAGGARLAWIALSLFAAGVCGGTYLIPLASFIQVRPGDGEKGKVLGVSNFFSFVAIALFGVLFAVISLLPPAWNFVVFGLAIALFAALYLAPGITRFSGGSLKDAASTPLALLLRAVLSLRYKVTEVGLDALAGPQFVGNANGETARTDSARDQSPEGCFQSTDFAARARKAGLFAQGVYSYSTRPEQKSLIDAAIGQKTHLETALTPGILFLPNHPALIDPVLVFSRLAGLKPRPLADEHQMSGLLPRLAGRLLRVVSIPDVRKDGRGSEKAAAKAIENIVAALKDGDHILLYPAGRLYRSPEENLGGNSGVARILEELPNLRVVLVRTSGLWGSGFSYASGKTPRFGRALLKGIGMVAANLFFFTPRREVLMEFSEPADLPRGCAKTELNRWLEAHYNVTRHSALRIPYFFWQGSAPEALPEAVTLAPPHERGETAAVPDDVRERVYAMLRESANLAPDHPLTPEDSLATSLGLDSLALMEFAAALEAEFGHPVPNLDPLVTVEDCLLAATGALFGKEDSFDAPKAWFALENTLEGSDMVVLPPKTPTLVHAFLEHARAGARQPLLADRSGMRTRGQILTGALALARRFASLPGKRLGIMLPAGPAAVAAWLAASLAGKEAVMINWTVGVSNMRHCVELAEVAHVVTATPLLDQLGRQGTVFDGIPVTWVPLDRLAASLHLWEKLLAAGRALLFRLTGSGVSAEGTPQTAVILFTSGSESRPKAVPLSHANILANAADLASVLKLRRKDRVLSMLPPFHSFGFMVGVVLPLGGGLQAACHPNPAESAALVRLTRAFRLTLAGATPTFLEGMLHQAKGTDHLASLRFVFVGAEKCPAHLWDPFARCCPRGLLCEGYGITECSPVIAVNRPASIVPGSIGHPLPSLDIAVVRENEHSKDRVAPGETGMLLVRGPSIFGGYLGDAPDPFVAFEGHYWYRTGDLVTLDQEGRLFFKGRLKRFVKIGGEMISLPQMEEALFEALRGRADLPADGPYIAVDVSPGSEDGGRAELLAFTPLDVTVQDLNRMLRDSGLSALHSIKRVVRIPAIPLLGTGKTDYQQLRRMV